jgi:hypothetical protein
MAARRKNDQTAIDQLLAEILVDAYGDEEQLWAFRQVFEDEVSLPADAYVIGEPVAVLKIDYEGNERRGLTAKCRRADKSVHVVAAADVVFPEDSSGSRYVAAYRKWLGLDPYPAKPSTPAGRGRQHKATAEDFDLAKPVELVVISVKSRAARCRLLGSNRFITLRASRLWGVAPGEILTVKPSKQWSYAGHPYLSGEILGARLDVAALGLIPLHLHERGLWDARKHYWGDEDQPDEDWAKPIIARGSRPMFEMEQVLPGEDPDDPFDDPITKSVDLRDAGDIEGSYKILSDLCEADLRCLDAHAHLGNFLFDHRPKDAIRHYEVGLRIGELSLPQGFEGLLPWACIDNRPFLRCLVNYGLGLWRLGRRDEAERTFERALWLNPTDNQGARFLLARVKAGIPWSAED